MEELKQLGYEEPALLTSYFRDPKLVVSKLKPQKVPPSFTDEENEESEKNPQSAITRLMGGGTAVGSEHADASKKSMMDALFTVSAIGKLTLALNLKKYTYVSEQCFALDAFNQRRFQRGFSARVLRHKYLSIQCRGVASC